MALDLNNLAWAEPRPPGDPTQHAFDVDLYDVQPAHRFPADLPDLWEISWPEYDMREMKRLARRWLYIAPPTTPELDEHLNNWRTK